MSTSTNRLSADPICGVSAHGVPPTNEENEARVSDSFAFFSKMSGDARRAVDEQARDWTDQVLRRLRRFRERGGSMQRASEGLRTAADRLDLCIDLIQDLRTRRYRDISWPAALVISVAVLYAVSPADFIPDAIPGLGGFDDALVLVSATRFAEKELRKYCEFRGVDPERYFGASPSTDSKTN